MSMNVNLSAGSGVDLFRLRTAANGPIIKAFVAANGTLQMRSDFGSTTRTTTTAMGTGWHNVELCGTVGSATGWNLYRDGTQIVTNWVADTGTTPVGRIQIGDTAAKTFTANFDHVVLDTAVGDDVSGDLIAPSVPGRPAGTSPSAGTIQISWAASTDPAPASLPITYRIYRDNGATSVGSSTTTSFTDTGAALVAGSSHTYTVDAVDAATNASAKSQASLAIIVATATDNIAPSVPGRPAGTSPSAGTIQISWAASTDPAPASLPITYRIYRDNGATSVGSSTTTSFTDTGAALVAGSSHTYTVDAVDAATNASAKSQASLAIIVATAGGAGTQPVPGHTRLAIRRSSDQHPAHQHRRDLGHRGHRQPGVHRRHLHLDPEQHRRPTRRRTTSPTSRRTTSTPAWSTRPSGPTFGGGGVTAVEASPDGTKLFVGGRFNTVNGVDEAEGRLRSTRPPVRADTGFTANAEQRRRPRWPRPTPRSTSAASSPGSTASRRVSLAAVNATTGAVDTGFVNNLSGGIGVNGELTVQQLDAHPRQQQAARRAHRPPDRRPGPLRHGHSSTPPTKQLLPWRTHLWDDNLQFVGGVTRIYAGDIAPDDSVLRRDQRLGRRPPADQRHRGRLSRSPADDNVAAAVDRPPLRQHLLGRHHREAVYLGGHFELIESPTSPRPVAGPRQRRLRHRPGPGGLRPRRRSRPPRPHRRARPGDRQGARVESPGLELVRGQQGHGGHLARPVRRRRRHDPGRLQRRPGRVLRLQHHPCAVGTGRHDDHHPDRGPRGADRRAVHVTGTATAPPAVCSGSRSRSRTATATSTSRTT